MTLEQLEQHIKDQGSLMATALMQYELSGCFSDRGQADAYRMRMEQAIAERVAKDGQE